MNLLLRIKRWMGIKDPETDAEAVKSWGVGSMPGKSRVSVRGREIETPEGSTPTAEKLPDGQYADHWVMSEEERSKGFIRPIREQYVHEKCGVVTRMPIAIAETYARDPAYYGRTFCCGCREYFPVGKSGEFFWYGTNEKVGS